MGGGEGIRHLFCRPGPEAWPASTQRRERAALPQGQGSVQVWSTDLHVFRVLRPPRGASSFHSLLDWLLLCSLSDGTGKTLSLGGIFNMTGAPELELSASAYSLKLEDPARAKGGSLFPRDRWAGGPGFPQLMGGLRVPDLLEKTCSQKPQWAELRLEGVSLEDAVCYLREEHSTVTTGRWSPVSTG